MKINRTIAVGTLLSAICLLPATPGLAQTGPSPTPTPQTNVGLGLDTPDAVPTGTTVNVYGYTPDTGTVRILFRKRGQAQFSVRRTLTPNADGRYATSYIADDDYRLYAQTDNSSTPPRLVVATPVIEAPATVRAGSAVPVTVRAAAGTVVSVSFRRRGQTAFAVRRTGTTNSSGRFTTTYRADADYRYYADERNGQRSAEILTQLRTPRSIEVSNDPAFLGQVVALDTPAIFVPGTTVTTVITGADGQSKELARVLAGRDGSVSTEVMIPTDFAVGRAHLRARSGDRSARGALYVYSASSDRS